MIIKKEAILSKTHYGLIIYAFVLRQYYPGEAVLSFAGGDCKPTKNPFNDDKPTLCITVEDNCAVHTDSEGAIVDGDAFDFAALHFNLSGLELLQKLNEEFHISSRKKNGFQNLQNQIITEFEPEIIKPKPPLLSYYKKPVTNVVPTKEITLMEVYNLIQGNEFATCTSTLRNIQDVKEARKYKAYNFDYVTFSGVFSKRNDIHLKKHSGLLTIDFDHISNILTLREELLEDEYFETELLFTSPSGDGLKWIIPIDLTKVKHQDYFKAVANYIQHTYSLEVDGSGKDVSRACFLPHDPNVFINPKYL